MSNTDPTAPDFDADRPAPPSPPSPPAGEEFAAPGAPEGERFAPPAQAAPSPASGGSTAYPPPPVDAGPPAYPSYAPPPPGPSDNPYAAPPAYGTPTAPGEYGTPAPPPAYGAPAPPAYGAPAPPAYGAPSSPYGAQAPMNLPGGGAVPSMGTRLLARLVDWVIMSVVYLLFSLLGFAGLMGSTGSDGEPSGLAVGGFVLAMLVFSAIGVAYEVVFIALRGATVGKQAMGLKVVREDNGGLPGWGPSLIRWGIPALANFICGLGFIIYLSPFWADKTGRQRGYHDQASGTVVVTSR